MDNKEHQLCKSIIREFIDITKDKNYDEEFRVEIMEDLREIKEEIEILILVYM